MNLQGCYTAIVTPFENGEVAWDTFRNLVEAQVIGGVDGIVPVGTTGESPTLGVDEHKKVIQTTVDIVNGRCQVIAGTGANATVEALELTKFAKAIGADASLQVTPYYNKPTPEGLYRHFATVADEADLPIVLYNVPGRSGREIPIDVIRRLSSNTNVVAVKEAGGSADRVSQTLNCCDITVLSGDDSLTLPMMVLGAKGVISVASNLLPAEVAKMVHVAAEGCWNDARKAHYKLYDLFNAMFVETNPIPVKAAMAMCGMIKEEYRLPMCPLAESSRAKLTKVLQDYGLDITD